MNILYIVSRPLEINSSSSIRNRATINGLLELGHNVKMITSKFDKNHKSFDNNMSNNKIETEYIELNGIQNVAKFGRKFKKLDFFKKYFLKIQKKINIYDNFKNIINHIGDIDISNNNYDLVISSSDPKSSHLLVYEMYNRGILKNTPWIQIWGDPFVGDITNTGLNKKRIKREEEKLLEKATKVIYVSKPTLIDQKNRYPQFKEKMEYVPIPYVKKMIYENRKNPVDGKISLLYCGDYGSKVRNISPLYEAIKSTSDKLTVCGRTDIKLESTENIDVHERVSFDKTKEYEKESDILIHLSNLRGTQIPGKIYQYSGTNKPILFILDGEKELLQKTFEPYNRYIFCDNTKEDIMRAIKVIKESNVTYAPVDEFSPVNIAKKILDFYNPKEDS